MEEVDEATLDEEEKAVRAQKLAEIEQRREARRVSRVERERVKAEQNEIKFQRREARKLKRELKELERAERQARRDAGT